MNRRLLLFIPLFCLMSCAQFAPKKVDISAEEEWHLNPYHYEDDAFQFFLQRTAEDYYGTSDFTFKEDYQNVALKNLTAKLYNDLLFKNLKSSPNFKRYVELKKKYEMTSVAKELHFLTSGMKVPQIEINKYYQSFAEHPQSAERLAAIEDIKHYTAEKGSRAFLFSMLLITQLEDPSSSFVQNLYQRINSYSSQESTKFFLYVLRFNSVDALKKLAIDAKKECEEMHKIITTVVAKTDYEFIEYFNQKNKEAGLAPLDAKSLFSL